MGGALHVEGVLGEHGGDDLVARMRRVHAVGDVQGVEADPFEVQGELIGLCLGATALDEVHRGDADLDGIVFADLLAHGTDDLVHDAHAILEAAAVLVHATVDSG